MSDDNVTESSESAFGLWRPTSAGSFSLVILGASLWGTDPLFRQWLALQVPVSVIVFWEHFLPALIVAPLAWRGLRRAMMRFTIADWLSLVALGCGASAIATLLFTEAFTYGSPATPVLLQQIQPLVAVVLARMILRERTQRRFAAYLVGGMAGAYLIAFPHPTDVSVRGWQPAMLTLGAAGLWGMGTVLGRRLGSMIPFKELTALRLVFGLLAASAVVALQGDAPMVWHLGAKSFLALAALALVPGLLALLVYYRGLRGTPASAATIGELAFPLTALVVVYLAFDATLTATQWVGAVVLATTMVTMGVLKSNNTPTGVDFRQPAHLASLELTQ